jgi:hypothetical protein
MRLFSFFIIVLGFVGEALAEPSTGVLAEMAKFRSEQGGKLTSEYIQKIAGHLSSLVVSEEQRAQMSQGPCSDNSDLQYVKSLTDDADPVVAEFEGHFMRIEILKCLKNTNVQKVMSVMGSVEFKKNGYSSVIDVVPNGPNAFCEKTKTLLGKSSYCYSSVLTQESHQYIKVKSTNYWNESTEDYKIEIYARESIASATQIQNDVQFRSMTYLRGKFPSFPKFLASKFIKSSQKETFDILAERLK